MERIDISSAKTAVDSLVRHQGTVSKVSKNTVTVSLMGTLHCEACNAKSACGVSDSGSKEIVIPASDQLLELHEQVDLICD